MLRSKFALILLAIASLLLTSSVAVGEPRIALLITNQAYSQPGAALSNTHRDGEILKAALERVGFKVWVAKDTANEGALLQAIGEHVQRLADAGPDAVGFFYYSGHGAADRPNGENFLIPTAVPLTHAAQLPLMAVRLERITSTLAAAGKMSFVVFDACRNVPLQRADKSPFKGFAPVREQSGLLLAFATEPGNVAIDQNLYAKALAEELVKPDLEAAQVFRRVRLRVQGDTKQAQSPEYLDRRNYDFHFAAAAQSLKSPGQSAAPPSSPASPRLSEAAEAWGATKDTQSVSTLEAFVRRFGDTFYGDLAKDRLTELKQVQARQAADVAKKKADEEARIKADAERQRLALLQQEEDRKRRESNAPVTECDRLAAAPNDPHAVAPGVKIESLDTSRAQPACEKAVTDHPGTARLHFQLGRIHRQKGANDRALADYSKAIELASGYAFAYLNRGNVYNDRREYDKALTDYSKAIELNPRYALAYHGRGNVYRDKRAYDRALTNYDKAIELNPQFADALYNRGVTKEAKGDRQGAIADYRRVMEIEPTAADAGSALRRLGVTP